MFRIYFKFFTRSVEPLEPEIFLENLRRHLGPSALPTRFAANDDESFLFGDDSVPTFRRLWWDGYVGWDRTRPKVIGLASLGNWGVHTHIHHSIEYLPGCDTHCEEFLTQTAAALKVDYAFVHLLSDKGTDLRPMDWNLPRAVALHLHRALPGIAWASCFGRPYLDLFGQDRLLSLPVSAVRQVNSEMIYVRLTGHVTDSVNRPQLIEAAQNVVREGLGRRAFYDPEDPDRDEVFDIHSSTGPVVAPCWPDPLTVPVIKSAKHWPGK